MKEPMLEIVPQTPQLTRQVREAAYNHIKEGEAFLSIYDMELYDRILELYRYNNEHFKRGATPRQDGTPGFALKAREVYDDLNRKNRFDEQFTFQEFRDEYLPKCFLQLQLKEKLAQPELF